MALTELEAETFLTYLRNTDPELYTMATDFIRQQIAPNGLGATTVTAAPTTNWGTSIANGLTTAISSLAPLAKSYQDYQTQAAAIKAASTQNILNIQAAQQQSQLIDAQNMQKMTYLNNFKSFGIPVLMLIAFAIYELKDRKSTFHALKKKVSK